MGPASELSWRKGRDHQPEECDRRPVVPLHTGREDGSTHSRVGPCHQARTIASDVRPDIHQDPLDRPLIAAVSGKRGTATSSDIRIEQHFAPMPWASEQGVSAWNPLARGRAMVLAAVCSPPTDTTRVGMLLASIGPATSARCGRWGRCSPVTGRPPPPGFGPGHGGRGRRVPSPTAGPVRRLVAGSHVTNHALMKKVLQELADKVPVAIAAQVRLGLVVTPSPPVRSVQEHIAYAGRTLAGSRSSPAADDRHAEGGGALQGQRGDPPDGGRRPCGSAWAAGRCGPKGSCSSAP